LTLASVQYADFIANVTSITLQSSILTLTGSVDQRTPITIGGAILFLAQFSGSLDYLNLLPNTAIFVSGSLTLNTLTPGSISVNVTSSGNLIIGGSATTINSLVNAGHITFNIPVSFNSFTHVGDSAVTTINSKSDTADFSIKSGTLELAQGASVHSVTAVGAKLKLLHSGVAYITSTLSVDLYSCINFDSVVLGGAYALQVYTSAAISGCLQYSAEVHDSQHTGKYNLIHAQSLVGTFVSISPSETADESVVYGSTYVYVDYANPKKADTHQLLTWIYVLAAFVGFLTLVAIAFLVFKIVAKYRKRGYAEIAK